MCPYFASRPSNADQENAMQQMVQQDNMNQEMSAMGTAMHHCCDLVVPLLNVFTDIGIH